MDATTFVVFVIPVSLAIFSLLALVAGIIVNRIDERAEQEEAEAEEEERLRAQQSQTASK